MKQSFNPEHLRLLKGLGLNEVQAKLYLTSLTHGLLSALELSRLTGINRQQIYEAAEGLVALGLYDITRKQRRKYVPADPAKLLKLGRQRAAELESFISGLTAAVPDFEALAVPKKRKVVVKYYEGIEKLRQAYENELEVSKQTEVLSFTGSIEDTFKFFSDAYWDTWNKKFVTYGSKSRMLVHNSKAARETATHDRTYRRETRYLDLFPIKVNIDVFNDVVLVVSFYDELALWIESPILAQAYRIMFNTFWELAKPYEKQSVV